MLWFLCLLFLYSFDDQHFGCKCALEKKSWTGFDWNDFTFGLSEMSVGCWKIMIRPNPPPTELQRCPLPTETDSELLLVVF